VSFSIDTRIEGNSLPVMELSGEIDVYSSRQLKQQMIAVIESGSKEMVVDLTDVVYLDSSALGVFIGGLKRMREVNGNILLVCPSERIRRVFEITGLDHIFDIYDTKVEAMQGLGRESE